MTRELLLLGLLCGPALAQNAGEVTPDPMEKPATTRPLWIKNIAVPGRSVKVPAEFVSRFSNELARQVWERDYGTIREAAPGYKPYLETVLLAYDGNKLEVVARQFGTYGQKVWEVWLRDVSEAKAIKEIAGKVRPEFRKGYKHFVN